MADVEKIRVYVVSSKEGPAVFKAVYERDVAQREDYRAIIEKMARDDGWDLDFAAGLRDVSSDHIQDGLNIRLDRKDGPIVIAIRLPKRDEHNQLEFRDKPIIELWTNSGTGETFIASEPRHEAGGHRWASFVCDPKKAKEGKLAKYIRDLPDRFRDHKSEMRIPFTYNFRDERMNFAPWVLSDHSHAEEGNKHSDSANFTHGGVHPYSSYYLTIDL